MAAARTTAGTEFPEAATRTSTTARRPKSSAISDLPPDLNNWELEQDLQAIERLMNRLGVKGGLEMEPRKRQRVIRQHGPEGAVPRSWHVGESRARARRAANTRRRQSYGAILSTVFTMGLMVLTTGLTLITWASFTGRDEWWSIALPVVLVGQTALLLAGLIKLNGLQRKQQQTRAALQRLHKQVEQLQHATTRMTTTHSTAAQSFYSHLAEGASPHILLADLKGQLDLLAMRMTRD